MLAKIGKIANMKSIRVAVTGQVASGKSTLCRFLQDLGATVVSADQIVHHLLLNDNIIQKQIEQLFGCDVFTEGKPSREKIAAVVFENREKLQALEAILHPAVREKIDRQFSKVNGEKLFVAEIPLLFEAGMEKEYDETVCVLKPNSDSDNNITKLRERVERQLSPKEKANRSSIVLLNRGSLDDLKKEAHLLFKILLENNV